MQGDLETMSCVRLPDAEIEYCERGAGEPLFLVHALPLQNPHGVGQVVVNFVRRHSIVSVGTGHTSV